MTKQARSASWKDVKTVLSQQSMPELLQLIRDLYALRPEVKDFLHARFLTSAKTLAPYKNTIQQSLSPDVIHGEDLDLARGRKAISDYKQATHDPVGTLELMVYYVECGNQFTVDYGDIDEGFYESLEAMFTQVVKTLQHSDQETIDRFLPRLEGIVRQAHGIGWGYYDTISETLEEAFLKAQEKAQKAVAQRKRTTRAKA
jgi:hypothetical protein